MSEIASKMNGKVCVNMMSVFWLRYVPHNLMALSLTDGDLLLSKLAWYMSEAVKSKACWMRKAVLLKKDPNPNLD
ncbi:hypothetical protein LUU34_00734900 [Aix galericulata]|nr:hypothetical protein LUU34_00734900 [Aix galericulata]